MTASPARRWRSLLAGPSLLVVRNITANVLGRSWSMLMNFAFVPVYIRLLGIEAYGVIAFFFTLIALFSFLDLGLSATLNREMARRTGAEIPTDAARDVVRTMEAIYWGIGLAISACVIGAAPWIAGHWLKAPGMRPETLTLAIRLMGVVIALHWPTGLYGGGLSGLQRQVTANTIDATLATARGVGAVLVLWLVSRSVEAFFVWQACISLATVVVMRTVLLRALGKASRRTRFDAQVLRDTWRFAGGMTALSLVSIGVQYSDKVVLTALLPLANYGRYMLANTLAATSATVALAVFAAMYPRLTQLVAAGDDAAVAKAYHSGTQLIALTVFPVAAVVLLFARELILFWTWDPAIAAEAAPIASVLVVGTALNATMLLPYALQLAHGYTRLNLIANVIGVVVLVPLTFVLTRAFGAVGAAFGWPLLNFGYVAVLAPLVHRRFLRGESRDWYLRDLLPPFLVAVTVAGAVRLVVPHDLAPVTGFVLAGVAGAASLAATALTTSRGATLARRYLAVAQACSGRPAAH